MQTAAHFTALIMEFLFTLTARSGRGWCKPARATLAFSVPHGCAWPIPVRQLNSANQAIAGPSGGKSGTIQRQTRHFADINGPVQGTLGGPLHAPAAFLLVSRVRPGIVGQNLGAKVQNVADSLDYGHLMHQALRTVLREALRQVEAEGLPGEHHFFIGVDTQHPDVMMPQWLKDDYPDEITIVMQNWFDELVVGEDRFDVTLSFKGAPERLTIPFDAVRTFVDPSVNFGLRFDLHEDQDDDSPDDEPPTPEDDGPGEEAGSVVQLDRFRK